MSFWNEWNQPKRKRTVIISTALCFLCWMIPSLVFAAEESMWFQIFPHLKQPGAVWLSYKPDAVKFYLPEWNLKDVFNPSAYIDQVNTRLQNVSLTAAIGNVFSSLGYIKMATNFTIFSEMINFLNPITDAVWDYLRTYWWELFFTLGIAYLLVGIILRRFVWMIGRFLLFLVFSGLLVALFSPTYHMWDKTLNRLHSTIQEHTQLVIALPTKKSGIQPSGNYVVDIGNSLYQLNVIYPFVIGQFGSLVDNHVITEYFALSSDEAREDYVRLTIGEDEDKIQNIIRHRDNIAEKMLFSTYFAWLTFVILGIVSMLIEILLGFQIIPLMITLMFASLPTDDAIGRIQRRFAIVAKLFLGKLGMAFVISVGAYVNVYLMNKVKEKTLSIDDAQLLVIISYLCTIYYCWVTLKWIWKNRDQVSGKLNHMLKGALFNQLLQRRSQPGEGKNSSPSQGDGGNSSPPVRSQPRHVPIYYGSGTPAAPSGFRSIRVPVNTGQSGGSSSSSPRSAPRSSPRPVRTP